MAFQVSQIVTVHAAASYRRAIVLGHTPTGKVRVAWVNNARGDVCTRAFKSADIAAWERDVDPSRISCNARIAPSLQHGQAAEVAENERKAKIKAKRDGEVADLRATIRVGSIVTIARGRTGEAGERLFPDFTFGGITRKRNTLYGTVACIDGDNVSVRILGSDALLHAYVVDYNGEKPGRGRYLSECEAGAERVEAYRQTLLGSAFVFKLKALGVETSWEDRKQVPAQAGHGPLRRTGEIVPNV